MFSQAHTVGNDAASKAIELVERTRHAVTLKLVELFPDDGVADAGGGFDDPVFVHAVAAVGKQAVKNERVDAGRVAVRSQFLKFGQQRRLSFWLSIWASAEFSEA